MFIRPANTVRTQKLKSSAGHCRQSSYKGPLCSECGIYPEIPLGLQAILLRIDIRDVIHGLHRLTSVRSSRPMWLVVGCQVTE